MTEDSNHAISNSFLLDDDSRLVSFYQDLKDSKLIFFSIFVKKKIMKGLIYRLEEEESSKHEQP